MEHPGGGALRTRTAGRSPAARRPTAATARPGRASATATQPAAARTRPPSAVPYAELHCHSNFSFLDGASHPEELAEEAARLGLEALALTDHDGFYGVVRFAEAAGRAGPAHGVRRRAVARACPRPQNGVRRPGGHATCWCSPASPRATAGSAARSARRSCAAGRRAARSTTWTSWPTRTAGHWLVLTGCRKGAVPPALLERRAGGGRARSWTGCVELFGRDNVAVELSDHGDPLDAERNDALAELAADAGPADGRHQQRRTTPRPARRRLATALAAVRARRSLDEIDGWLPAGRHRPPALRRGDGRPVRPLPGRGGARPPSSARELRLRPAAGRARSCRRSRCPPGHTEMTLAARAHLARRAPRRYGRRRGAPRGRTRRSTTSWRSSRSSASPATS